MIEPEPELSDYQQLASEVKQLTAERDYLLAQARKESESLERKETVIKAQFEEQLQELANKISQVILVSSQVSAPANLAHFCIIFNGYFMDNIYISLH